MLAPPFSFGATLRPDELAQLGQLSLRWSGIELVVGHCLKSMLRLTEEEADVVVFPLSVEQRLQKIRAIVAFTELNAKGRAAFKELTAVMPAIQYVRNTAVHAFVSESADGKHVFHSRGRRSHTKDEILSVEELTNYAAHVALAFRYALGLNNDPDRRYPLPATRPKVPEFLLDKLGGPKSKKR